MQDEKYKNFGQEYQSRSLPALINGAMHRWPAMGRWSLENFAADFGHQKIICDHRFGIRMRFNDFRDYMAEQAGFHSFTGDSFASDFEQFMNLAAYTAIACTVAEAICRKTTRRFTFSTTPSVSTLRRKPFFAITRPPAGAASLLNAQRLEGARGFPERSLGRAWRPALQSAHACWRCVEAWTKDGCGPHSDGSCLDPAVLSAWYTEFLQIDGHCRTSADRVL